jgi:6-phosphogluconolactonase (cycloisomerase 2 family)
MAAEVPRNDASTQFLFAASTGASLISGFKTSSDGSLTPVPGSPFVTIAPARAVMPLNSNLIVAMDSTVAVFAVDKESGSLQLIDSSETSQISWMMFDSDKNIVFAQTQAGVEALRLSKGRLELRPASREEAARVLQGLPVPQGKPWAALDGENSKNLIMYVADSKSNALFVLRGEPGRRMVPLPNVYPLPSGGALLTLMKP